MKLKTRLKRMVTKASIMGWSVIKVHKAIQEVLEEYGVANKEQTKKGETK